MSPTVFGTCVLLTVRMSKLAGWVANRIDPDPTFDSGFDILHRRVDFSRATLLSHIKY